LGFLTAERAEFFAEAERETKLGHHPKFELTIVVGAMLLAVTACGSKSPTDSKETAKPSTAPKTEQPPQPPADTGVLSPGEASGSYTAKGETVMLKYAYAGRGQRFNEESVIILLTDQPIPPEAVDEEIKSQTLLDDEKIKGLEYVISKDGYWIRFHPSQYQESKTGQMKDYWVENNIVRGSDEDKGDLTDGRYSRSVKFVATIK